MPALEIREESLASVAEHACIPIAFVVDRVLELTIREGDEIGLWLREVPVAAPWIKDYDGEPGNHPTRWAERFDVSSWGLLSAWTDGQRVGGAVVAFDKPNVHSLEGRTDLASLWDLRVRPDRRRLGVGSTLFAACEGWARTRACTQLRIETQNINVAACRFYADRGCTLGAVHRFAYPGLPNEIQLVWYKDLAR